VSPVPRCERANAFAGIQPRTGGTLECDGLYRRIYQAVAGLPARKIDCVAVYDKQINVKRGHRVIELAVKYYF
jgi:hypothetical protein